MMTMRIHSHICRPNDVTEAILAPHNNEKAAMLVYQTNPVLFELFSYVNTSFITINVLGCWTAYCSIVK